MLRLLDRGEQDDKLIAVVENTPFFEVNNLVELDRNFNGTKTIIATFFKNYKGPEKMESLCWSNDVEAKKILEFSIKSYKKKFQ
jgi:inorganic pyrophosphatase